MKKIYTLAFAAFTSLSVMAQQAIIPAELGTKLASSTPGTAAAGNEEYLGLDEFSSEFGVTFDLGGAGYIFGSLLVDTTISSFPATITNDALGRGFISNDAYNVTGAMIWFALKSAANANPADLTITLNELEDGVSLLSQMSDPQNPDGFGPGDELNSATLAFDDIDTSLAGGITIVYFDTPTWKDGDFSIVVDYSALYGAEVDTIALFNEVSGSGSADGTFSWTLQNAVVTTPIGTQEIPLWLANSAYDLEADLSIFAIVEESGVGIEEQGFLNGVKVTTYPNPAVSSDVVTIQYGLENAAEKVEVNVYDMNGKLMFSHVEGDRVAGIHTIDIPAGTLSAGSYVYSLEANGGRMAKQLQILK
jgi:hypothetical protein